MFIQELFQENLLEKIVAFFVQSELCRVLTRTWILVKGLCRRLAKTALKLVFYARWLRILLLSHWSSFNQHQLSGFWVAIHAFCSQSYRCTTPPPIKNSTLKVKKKVLKFSSQSVLGLPRSSDGAWVDSSTRNPRPTTWRAHPASVTDMSISNRWGRLVGGGMTSIEISLNILSLL